MLNFEPMTHGCHEATVQQQPPAFIKAHGRAPGMDLLDP